MLIPAATTFVVASFLVGMLLKRIGALRVLAIFGVLFTTGLIVFAVSSDHL